MCCLWPCSYDVIIIFVCLTISYGLSVPDTCLTFQKRQLFFNLKPDYCLSSLECIKAIQPLYSKNFFFFFFCWIDKLCWHLLGAAHFKIQSSINNKCPPFLIGDSTCSESSDLCYLYLME